MTISIAIDAMGGDNAPDAIVRGAVLARGLGASLILVGDEARLQPLLARADAPHCTILHAPSQVLMGEKALAVLRTRKDTSLEIATRCVAEGKAAGVISAGHSGASLLMASKHLRRPGIRKPVLGTFLPTTGTPVFVLDVGANVDTSADDLVNFASLGSDFYRAWTGKRMPTVGLLNIGGEPGKGNRQAREAYELLMVADGIDFTGNVEGRAVAGGLVDVVVCDGFTGNILLKFTEGLGGTILTLMARETRDVLAGKWWAGLVKGIVAAPLLAVRKRIDYSEYGGAPLLGLTGGFFICHGASNAKAIYNAVRRMLIMLERGLHEDQGR